MDNDTTIIKLLEDIKKMMVIQLMKGEKPISSEELGPMLGVTGRTIRNFIAPEIKKTQKKRLKRKRK